MLLHTEIHSGSKQILNQSQLKALEDISSLAAEISPKHDKCRINFLSTYVQTVYSHYPCEEYTNVDNILYISSGGLYLLGSAVQIVYLPKDTPDKTRILIKDYDSTWGNAPLKMLNFSKSCAGVKLNKTGITASFVFSSTTGDWSLEAWSYKHVTVATTKCDIINQRITLVEEDEGIDSFVICQGISEINVINAHSFYLYKEYEDYIFKSRSGEIIPIVSGKLRIGDELIIRYTK